MDRTPSGSSSLKAIHVKVAEDNISIYRGGKGYVWVSLNSVDVTIRCTSTFCNLFRMNHDDDDHNLQLLKM